MRSPWARREVTMIGYWQTGRTERMVWLAAGALLADRKPVIATRSGADHRQTRERLTAALQQCGVSPREATRLADRTCLRPGEQPSAWRPVREVPDVVELDDEVEGAQDDVRLGRIVLGEGEADEGHANACSREGASVDTAVVLTLTGLPQTAIDAFGYGLCGAVAGALVTWILGKRLIAKPWRELVALWRQHTATQRQLAAALKAHTEQLQRLAGPPRPEEAR